jgi:dGTP triphosphohydrolase
LHKKTILELNEGQKKLFNKDKVADIYPEYYLINVKNFNNIAKDTLDEWIYFLKNEEIEDGFKAKGLLEAKKKLDVLKMTPAEKIAYEMHQKALRREASLYESTYVLGKEEERIKQEELREKERIKQDELREEERIKQEKLREEELLKQAQVTAIKLLPHMTVKQVSDITSLSIEEVEKLKLDGEI